MVGVLQPRQDCPELVETASSKQWYNVTKHSKAKLTTPLVKYIFSSCKSISLHPFVNLNKYESGKRKKKSKYSVVCSLWTHTYLPTYRKTFLLCSLHLCFAYIRLANAVWFLTLILEFSLKTFSFIFFSINVRWPTDYVTLHYIYSSWSIPCCTLLLVSIMVWCTTSSVCMEDFLFSFIFSACITMVIVFFIVKPFYCASRYLELMHHRWWLGLSRRRVCRRRTL